MSRKPLHLKFAFLCVMFLALLVLLVPWAAGCGGDDRAVTVSQPEGLENALPQVYDTSPEATSNLIQQASNTLSQNIVQGKAVHFTMDSKSTFSGATSNSTGEGDMIFPDQVKMTMRIYPSNQPVEMILTGGKVYTKSADTGYAWKSSGGGLAPPDLSGLARLLDFTRSSRNFGQESLKGDRATYHLQLDIDSALAADNAKKTETDPEVLKQLDATRDSVVTVDLWIGINDLMIYQQRVTTANAALGSSSEQTFIYSNWGESVDISKPCDNC